MKMSVYTKLSIVMIMVISTVLGITQYIQYQNTSSQIKTIINNNLQSFQDISNKNISDWKAREEQNALNLFRSVAHGVAKSLERGEMTKFNELLAKQKNIEGLLEFSLFNREDKISHSTDSAFLQKILPEEVDKKISPDKPILVRQTEEAIEIYELQTVSNDCVRCHIDWNPGERGGIIHLRYSTKVLKEAEQKNLALVAEARQKTILTMADLQKNILMGTIFIGALICLMLLALLYVIGSRLLIKPLNQITSSLKNCMSRLSDVSKQTLESSQKLVADASDQASSLQETSASLEEMSSMTSQNANNARHAQTIVQETISSIKNVNDSMKKVDLSMNEIVQASTQTFNIIKTIDDIAYQTNLLALNAAVEAARAGEAGASFAVVADEVRNLAMKTGESAKNTTSLIEQMINKIKSGNEMVHTTSQAFFKLTERSEQVEDIIREIATASEEQAKGIEQVNTATIRIDKVTQENAASAEKNAATSQDLNLQIEEMENIVQTLSQLNGGKG